MPDNNFGFLEKTFDLSKYCKVCGIGKIQMAPFRIRKQPNLSKKNVFQLNWIFDEYFVLKEIWEKAFQPLGIGFIPVLLHKSGDALDDIVQLKVESFSNSPVKSEGIPTEACTSCSRLKLNPIASSKFPGFEVPPIGAPMFRSREYWGSGARAFNEVFATEEVKANCERFGIKGMTLKPIP
jgi:hypothetical protein